MIQKTVQEMLSVVIPVFNEGENVAALLKETEDALKNIRHEIIIVDDGSTDNTREAVKKSNTPRTILIELKKNYGQSLALAAGIDYAKGDYIATLDGDMQNDPADLIVMLERAKNEDWDVVTGIRENRKDSFSRKLVSKLGNFLVRKSTGLHLQDQGCGIKVFRNETAKELNLYGEMHRYINLLAHLNGARITEIPVNHRPRKFGQSKYGMGRTTKVINDLVLLLFRRKYLQKPIYFFGNIGLISFFIGGLISAYLLFVKFGMGQDIGNRPLLILGVLLLFMGVQFFTTGIVVDLLMRTYFESQQKRPYKIRKIIVGDTEEAVYQHS